MKNSKNHSLQQKLRNIGYTLAIREEYEQYLQEAYEGKYRPQRTVGHGTLRASHRGLLQDLYRREKRG